MRTYRVAHQNSRWLNKTVLGVALASLCSDVGHEMATASMPLLLATLGASSAALGLIEGSADLLASFAKLLSGHYSDRLKRRKPLAVLGYFLTASGMASFALATSWWHVLGGRAAGWLGRGVRTPVRNVLMTEATVPETRGKAFGFERAMDSAGAVLGPLLSMLLIGIVGLRPMLALTLIPGLLAALLIWVLVEERAHEPAQKASLWTGLAGLPVNFKKYLMGVGVAGVGDFSNTLLILWATQAWIPIYGDIDAARRAMSCYVAYNVVYMISCAVSGSLADKFPKHTVLALGYSLAVIPAAALLVPGASMLKFGVVFLFSGVYMGVWETLESTTAAELLPKEQRGVGFGALATVNGIGDFVSSALVGVLWVVAPALSMGAVIACSLAGAWMIYRNGEESRGASDLDL